MLLLVKPTSALGLSRLAVLRCFLCHLCFVDSNHNPLLCSDFLFYYLFVQVGVVFVKCMKQCFLYSSVVFCEFIWVLNFVLSRWYLVLFIYNYFIFISHFLLCVSPFSLSTFLSYFLYPTPCPRLVAGTLPLLNPFLTRYP